MHIVLQSGIGQYSSRTTRGRAIDGARGFLRNAQPFVDCRNNLQARYKIPAEAEITARHSRQHGAHAGM